MENLTGGNPPVRPLPCVVPCKLYFEEKDISEYSIDLTSHGFVTDDPLIYIVGYRYTYNGQTTTYGYKMHQTEEGFAVIEEGVEVGEFITGNGGNNDENNGCV